jgi:predicted dithiol-disulfide oxidoreductase (DUF899 family)
MSDHPVVSHDAWLGARTAFLAKEKEFTRLRDELSRQRRALPWEAVDKPYVFDGPRGKQTLAELFSPRSQLVVYHFMFAPEWDAGCKSCSFWADNFNGIDVHLAHRDVSFVAISRAPLAKIDAFQRRMGWSFPWLSSSGSDFNYDYGVSFTPEAQRGEGAVYNYTPREKTISDQVGISVFAKNEQGAVFHTYSCYERGVDMLNGAYHYLDLVPKGRDEDQLKFTQSWVRHHDAYEVRVDHAPEHPIPRDGLLTRCLSGLSVCHGTGRNQPTRAPWSAPRCHVIPSFGNEHDPCSRFVSRLSVATVRPLTSSRSEAHRSTL